MLIDAMVVWGIRVAGASGQWSCCDVARDSGLRALSLTADSRARDWRQPSERPTREARGPVRPCCSRVCRVVCFVVRFRFWACRGFTLGFVLFEAFLESMANFVQRDSSRQMDRTRQIG